MATVYASINGKQRSATQKLAQTPPDGGTPGLIISEYVGVGDAIATIINLATIPNNTMYRVLQVNNVALGAAATCSIGRAGATAEQLAAGADINSTTPKVANAGFWRCNNTGADEDVILTTAGGTITGRLQVVIQTLRGNFAPNQP